MKQAEVLQYLRRHGHSDTAVLEFLRAMASTLHITDPTCEALDACIARIEDNEAKATAAQEWAADDAACKRGNAAGSIPAFLAHAL